MDPYGILPNLPVTDYQLRVKERSDSIINYILTGYFLLGLVFASLYETWLIALGIGSISLLAYYSVKWALPQSDLYQYVLSTVLGLFMAQFIYQMHGLFEMHFFAFIGSAVLITYQKWKLQIPMMLFVLVHHAVFGYLQNAGLEEIYFTKLDYFDMLTFTIHILLAAAIFCVCGLWSYRFEKYYELQINQNRVMAELQQEAQLSTERKNSEQIQRKINEELRMSNAQLEAARQQADQANLAKSTFLATMSHEIRTPMNGVIGMTTLLQQTALTEEQHEFTETIAICGETLIGVINNVLDFSKIESGHLELEQVDFNLRQSIEDVLDMFGGKAALIGIDLVYQIDESVPVQIVHDDFRLRQILINLVGNAIKFTQHGEVCVSVHVENKAFDQELQLRFDVRDTGIGIPRDKVDRLFKAFSQVDSSTTRKYGGSGLGLAIVKKLVNLMGGQIRVSSEPLKGSTFSFTIKTHRGTDQIKERINYEMAEYKGKKILVVDDNATNLSILKHQLENWQLRPLITTSGKEALKILEENQDVDLVITDMQMPVMDGVMLGTKIRHYDQHTPLILLSSVGEELETYQKQLFTSILTKPFRQRILSRHIINALQGKIKTNIEPEHFYKNPVDFSLHHPIEILVVDDNMVNQHMVVRLLQKMGYKPDVSNNGQQAVKAANLKTYDLILMDIQMPVMDGLEATRLIRKMLERQPTIIALTANTLEDIEQQCLDAGMNDYMGKPIRLDELTSKIKKWNFV
ncbi:response regulator [Dyadobacter sediminis]|uniref:Sensory/regulatory protein RpfC n=1 Tax=Dyadobacter sediminis TaxID=1493691 RepID=A0A5R9KIP8_9BACT|nr:response regulator [Dyadobacter sediminis]TLU96054.1 response regulator [Dyadobacter sediminis]GGB78855.1 hypothetical protein GCM10011325_03000 [Dyadobacter sediminis]